jgi:hypothetical protein
MGLGSAVAIREQNASPVKAKAQADAVKAEAARRCSAKCSRCVAAHEASWRNPKYRRQRHTTLRDDVVPRSAICRQAASVLDMPWSHPTDGLLPNSLVIPISYRQDFRQELETGSSLGGIAV